MRVIDINILQAQDVFIVFTFGPGILYNTRIHIWAQPPLRYDFVQYEYLAHIARCICADLQIVCDSGLLLTLLLT